ncbi:MAG: hypothetical protein PHG08_00115 [Bacilli bacterium]|nr:hypothetical protein [Bacilli bacterium]
MEQHELEKINSLEVRVSVIEVEHRAILKDVDIHKGAIKELSIQHNDMLIALEKISGKFDILIAKLQTSFRIISAAFILTTTLVSGFWIYQTNMDTKIQNIATQQHNSITTNVESIKDLQDQK